MAFKAIAWGVLSGALLAASAALPQSAIAPATIKWIKVPFPPGVEIAFVAGDGKSPELYTQRVRMKTDVKVPPHTHPDARMVTVLSGEMIAGRGATIDAAKGELVGPGGFFFVPAGVIHWVWAKSDVIYQESGIGPSGTNWLNR